MIPHPKSTRSRSGRRAAAAYDDDRTPVSLPVPDWLRRTVGGEQSLAMQCIADSAVIAGAALATLDAVVRRRERWAGVWRQRLALAAAEQTARALGRAEDEAALRDALVFTRPVDFIAEAATPGPAGRLLLAWRGLAARPAQELLTQTNIAVVVEEFGYACDDEAAAELAAELRQLAHADSLIAALTGALTVAGRHGLGHAPAAWFADALMARRLGWDHALPLLGASLPPGNRTGRRHGGAGAVPATDGEVDAEGAKRLLATQARAALRAIDLSADLGRRAQNLLAVAPKLRARGAPAIVERLLNEDALVAARGEQKSGISDRGLRRLFDRLVALGAVRELSGRPTFRIYGL